MAAAVAVTVVVGAAVGAGWAAAHRLQNNITTADVTGRLGTNRPAPLTPTDPDSGRPLNILVVGSDSRHGTNSFIGGRDEPPRSDTTLVLHLAADRRSALAVSIPRDSMVELPSCVDQDGTTHPGGPAMFNAAYERGGVACTQRSVEQLTQVRIDHYVEIDFAGFAEVVDALGGVDVCLPEAAQDRLSGLSLPAGRSRVGGQQALAFVRARHALGDGGDLGRIERQQVFLASVLQRATSAGTLSHPDRLYGFLSAVTRALTMDPELARLPRMLGLGRTLGGVGLSRIQFLTVPVGAYPDDPNRLQWTDAADDLWRAVRLDLPIRTAPPDDGTADDPSSGPSHDPTSRSSPGQPTASPGVMLDGVRARSADSGICS